MFFVSIIFLIILIPSIQSLKPTLKLTFNPSKNYYKMGEQVEIHCQLINSTSLITLQKLWHVDNKTRKRTLISPLLLTAWPDDAPDVFKQNKNQRLELFDGWNLRINSLQLEDSARYECNCPDCEGEPLRNPTKDLQVMKLSKPKWHIKPSWPIQEHANTTIKCTVNDFYPYIDYKIIYQHHDISNEGKSVVSNNNTYSQNFSWETTITPTADSHNTTLQCIVTQGDSEQYATKNLQILFAPRFLKCHEKQGVDTTQEKATIECSYAGNPHPQLVWLRQTDEKHIISDLGITIETIDEQHGKYKSIVTFHRDKLVALPLITTTTKSAKIIKDNYYQQLLNGGFIVKLLLNNERGSRKINIVSVSDVNQARSHVIDSSTIKTIRNLSTSVVLFSFLVILYMIEHH